MVYSGPLSHRPFEKGTAAGNQYALTMTDLFSKWVTAEPLEGKSGTEIASIITNKRIDFGLVDNIITDRGAQQIQIFRQKVCPARSRNGASCRNGVQECDYTNVLEV